MTKTMSTIHEGILKNVNAETSLTGQALANLILAEANRREHLSGAVKSATWDPQFGVTVLVDNAGHREHLANAIGLPRKTTRYRSGALIGEARVGNFMGYRTVVWNLEL